MVQSTTDGTVNIGTAVRAEPEWLGNKKLWAVFSLFIEEIDHVRSGPDLAKLAQK